MPDQPSPTDEPQEKPKHYAEDVIYGSDDNENARREIPAPQEGFSLPVDIPGAPDKVDFAYLQTIFVESFKAGVSILRKEDGVYLAELRHSNWWQFWSYVGVAYFITAIISTLTSFILSSQVSNATGGADPNIFTSFTTMALLIPLGVVALYVGLYVSHRWVTGNRGGQGSLPFHANAIAIPVVTANLISTVAGFFFSIVPAFSGIISLLSLMLAIYALFVAADGIQMVHKVERNTAFWTVGVMLLAQFGASFVLGLLLAPLLITSSLAGF